MVHANQNAHMHGMVSSSAELLAQYYEHGEKRIQAERPRVQGNPPGSGQGPSWRDSGVRYEYGGSSEENKNLQLECTKIK